MFTISRKKYNIYMNVKKTKLNVSHSFLSNNSVIIKNLVNIVNIDNGKLKKQIFSFVHFSQKNIV